MTSSGSITELAYFPPISFFVLLLRGNLIIEQHEHYQKRSFRNKCLIANAQGIQRLSIPLRKGKHEKLPIRQVMIADDEDWQKQHRESIRSAYGRAPYFVHYYPSLNEMLEKKESSLFQWNIYCLETILSLLDIPTEYKLSKTYHSRVFYENDYRDKINLKNYDAGRIVISPYPQVFGERHPFFPNLSILDLLFCQGPEAIRIIENTPFKF